jgi:hypothetical protein
MEAVSTELSTQATGLNTISQELKLLIEQFRLNGEVYEAEGQSNGGGREDTVRLQQHARA